MEINSNGYEINENKKLVHRISCRKAHGWFPPTWIVHHCDGNKLNNAPENLIALTQKFHQKLHTYFGFNTLLPSRSETLFWFERFFLNPKKCKQRMRRVSNQRRHAEWRTRRIAYPKKLKTKKKKKKDKPIQITKAVKVFKPVFLIRKSNNIEKRIEP